MKRKALIITACFVLVVLSFLAQPAYATSLSQDDPLDLISKLIEDFINFLVELFVELVESFLAFLDELFGV